MLVGILGGFVFVNMIYMVYNNDLIDKGEKEISFTIIGFFTEMGVLASSVIGLLILSNRI